MKNIKIQILTGAAALALGVLSGHAPAFGQQTSAGVSTSVAASSLSLTPYIPASEAMDPAVSQTLDHKLRQVLTANGVAATDWNGRFVIAARPVVQTKDITATAPPKQAYTIDLNLYIGDGYDGKLFATCSRTLKGVGDTETKAYLNALRGLPAKDPTVVKFVDDARVKIIDYYNANIDRMILEAQTLASRNALEQAVWMLAGVPSVCEPAYGKASAALKPIYQKYIDRQSRLALDRARNLWNAHQDAETAAQVAELLGEIDPSASCYKEAQAFSTSVGSRVRQLDQREWNFKLQVQKDETSVRKTEAQAIASILGAYMKNQQTVVYRTSGWW